MAKEIPFVYLPLKGGSKYLTGTVPAVADLESKVDDILAAGLYFEVKELDNNLFGFSVMADPNHDIAFVTSNNGPGVEDAKERLIRKAHEVLTGDHELHVAVGLLDHREPLVFFAPLDTEGRD